MDTVKNTTKMKKKSFKTFKALKHVKSFLKRLKHILFHKYNLAKLLMIGSMMKYRPIR